MLDAIIELFARAVVEWLFGTLFYGIGWLMLRAITLGCYPPRHPRKHDQGLVALFPVAVVCVGLALAYG